NEFMQQEWFKNLGLSRTKMYFTIFKSDKVPIGIVRCDEWDQINNSIRIGIDIEKSHRTQGYAEEAYRALIPYLFFKLNIHRIWLLVLEYNAPAIGLYKKLGFTEEGVQKAAVLRDARYHNYIMMSLIATDHEQTA
ncbi:GNAT family N-acetyltransferase, partial [Candidatus Woesebacteria bacterium]|nr:GNAT family N-acetyltransferase [Candidatus Woesebacteria bacterium]